MQRVIATIGRMRIKMKQYIYIYKLYIIDFQHFHISSTYQIHLSGTYVVENFSIYNIWTTTKDNI